MACDLRRTSVRDKWMTETEEETDRAPLAGLGREGGAFVARMHRMCAIMQYAKLRQ